MLILVPKITNRVIYSFRLLLTRLCGVQVEFTTDINEFESADIPKLSYGIRTSSGLFLEAVSLLFETKVTVKQIVYTRYKELPAPFAISDKHSLLPFDVFAASFYLVARYEEYLPHIRDHHGRFLASGSEAFREGFLDKPLVNCWAASLRELLNRNFPGISMKKNEFRLIPTIDIDAAYAFKHKGFTRAMGGFVKSLLDRNSKELVDRIKVATGRKKDPFDTFEYQQSLWKHFGLKPYYFVLFGNYGMYDKNIPVNNRFFRDLVKSLADTSFVGIHPSYASSLEADLLQPEVKALSKLLRRDVIYSRQHFLRLELPGTYRNLIRSDIQHDFTMGYAEMPGFRASICTAFPFYDLDEEAETSLMIHPFALMDGNFIDYMQVTPAIAYEKILQLIQEVKEVGGDFIPLWHNQTLSFEPFYTEWRQLFVQMLENATGIKMVPVPNQITLPA